MHGFMLKPDPECFTKHPILSHIMLLKNGPHPTSNPHLVVQDVSKGRPFVWNLAVRMALFGVIHIGVDSAFENESI